MPHRDILDTTAASTFFLAEGGKVMQSFIATYFSPFQNDPYMT